MGTFQRDDAVKIAEAVSIEEGAMTVEVVKREEAVSIEEEEENEQ